MKLLNNNFKPMRLTIIIEKEEEAKALYAIFNHMKNIDLIGLENAEEIKEKIGKKYYVPQLVETVIANNISYGTFYNDFYKK